MRLPKYLKLTVICAQDDTQNLPFFHFGLFQVIFFYKIYLFVVKVIVYFQFCKNESGYKKYNVYKNWIQLKCLLCLSNVNL